MTVPRCPDCYGETVTVRTNTTVNVSFRSVLIEGVGFWGDECVERNVVDIIKPEKVNIHPEDVTSCDDCGSNPMGRTEVQSKSTSEPLFAIQPIYSPEEI